MSQCRPEDHLDRCYCGAKATLHIRYGSGCGHVCARHAKAIKRHKPYATVDRLRDVGQR